jgi:hypothetical protein
VRPPATEVTALIKRLATGHNRTLSNAELVEHVLVWQDVLDGVPMPEAERAVDAMNREPSRFMPKAAEVRIRALELARRSFGPTSPEGIVWHTDDWTEGVDPDTRRPGLCLKCGNVERINRDTNGTLHGYVGHRDACPNRPKAIA